MTDAVRARIGRVVGVIAVLCSLAGAALYIGTGLASEMYADWALHNAAGGAALGTVFYLMVQKQPSNGAVWAIGGSALLQGVGQTLASAITAVLTLDQFGRELVGTPWLIEDLPAAIHIAAWLQQWSWVPGLGLLLTFGLLLFPDGRLPSHRWRPVAWFAGVAVALGTLGFLVETDLLNESVTLPPLPRVGLAMLGLAILLSASALVVRYRHAVGDERHQLRWFGFGLVLLGVTSVVTFGVGSLAGVGDELALNRAATLIVLPVVVSSLAIAILKYRLYDIDIVISRSLTYGALAIVIGAVYVGIVVGVGALLGQGDRASFELSIVATALLAMTFQPLRRWVQRWANRLVFGERATPYEVLARFSRRAAEASDEELVDRIPRLIVDGTGSSEAALWVRTESGFRIASSWPEPASGRRLEGRDGFTDPEADYSLPVFHDDELLGGISLGHARGETITPSEEELLETLAGGTGLVGGK